LFSPKEISSIDRSYFNIVQANSLSVTLQSKNTKHYWHILHQEYHSHKSQPNLKKALQEIKNHDAFQLNIRDKEKRACRTTSATSSHNQLSK
jgi:hypothetical protein